MYSAQKAFTLIELLISVSLILVITAAIVPSFNKYMDNQYTKQAIEQVKDDLRTTQNRALTGENSTTPLGSSEYPLYWGIKFVQNTTTYEVFYSYGASSCYPLDTDYTVHSTSSILPGDNVIRSTTGCVFFSFTNGDSAAESTVIVGPPPPSDSDSCRRLKIYKNGFIEVLDDLSC